MNIKVLAWIIIVLILAAIAIQIFVPKKVADGKITTFGGNEAIEEEITTEKE